ncbi:hypothetical protein CR513_30700, partial [Mucuna pruriens]
MPVTRNQASSTNRGEEDTLQRLLHTIASLQAHSDEQSRLRPKKERRSFNGNWTPSKQLGEGEPPRNQEIDETRVPPNFREIMVEPFDGSIDPHAHLQAFQTQMYISGGDDKLSCKLFPGTLRGVAM